MLKKIASSIPLVIIGLLMIYASYSKDNDSMGLMNTLIWVTLTGSFLLVFSVIIILNVINRQQPFNPTPFYATSIIILGLIITNCFGNIHGADLLSAKDKNYSVNLALRANGTCYIRWVDIDFGYRKTVGYYIKNDTIGFNGDLRNGIYGQQFADHYFIDRNKRRLVPLGGREKNAILDTLDISTQIIPTNF